MSRDFSETYYRKRFRKPFQQSNNYEIMACMKKKAQITFGDSSSSAKHDDDDVLSLVPLKMLQPSSQNYRPLMLAAPEMNITAGSIYEIAHVHLPTRTPLNLRSVRVAMVSEKTDVTVAIRYPSMESLGKYFSSNNSGVVDAYPALDENFVMGIGLAARVLLRKVSFQECAEKKQFHEFWLVGNDGGSRKGYCALFDQLNGNGMLRWGTRRRVRFLDKHSEPATNTNNTTATDPSISFEVARVELVENEGESMEEDEEEKNENGDEDENEDDEGGKEEDEEEDDDGENEAVKEEEESEEEDEDVKVKDTKKVGVKRKRYDFRASVRQPKKVKRGKQPQKQQKKAPKKQNRCRQLIVLKNPKDRWSSERYKSAEKSLWEVMKAKGAMANNPILRPALRVEARKKIGDTGLLDHLLKHMAGKVAPCGKDRFRRRHNAEGQMEYWLESANLFDIRKQAGVIDPYWVPPPGWELGDSVTQDPIFAKELKLLKEEILELKRYANKKQSQLEEEVRKLRSDMKELKSRKKKGESQAIMVSSIPSADQGLIQLSNSSACAILDLNKAPEQEKNKEQQINISEFVKELQEKLAKLESEVQERSKSNSALMVPSDSFYLKEIKQVGEVEQQHRRGKEGQRIVAGHEGSQVKTDNHQADKEKAPEAEKAKTALAAGLEGSEKAARIEKLRSGFRICKPQGTFLWPSMMTPTSSSPSSHQIHLQMEDLLLVPTPPSISLTPPRLPYQHHQAAPQLVKPLAERHRGFTVTAASTMSESTTYDEDTATTNTTITTTTVMPHHFLGSANEE